MAGEWSSRGPRASTIGQNSDFYFARYSATLEADESTAYHEIPSLFLCLVLLRGGLLAAREPRRLRMILPSSPASGDTELKAAEIRDTIRGLDANAQAAIARDPSALSQVVRAILTQRLVLQEAQAAKWDQNPGRRRADRPGAG